MEKVINDKIDIYVEHGYPFAYGIINIKSKRREADIDIDIEKGDYVVVKDVITNLKDAESYLRIWGKTVTGKSYNELRTAVLSRKVASLSFAESRGDFEVIKERDGYLLFFPLKENKRSVLSGHLSYNNKTVNGRLSFASNSFLGKNGNIGFFYENTDKIKEFQVNGNLINIGYGDFDIRSKLHYLTDVSNDYLIHGEAAVGYKSYNTNYFAMGIGMYRGFLAGNTKYAFVENRFRKNTFSFLWRLEGDQSDKTYYSVFRIKSQFDVNHSKFTVVSSLLGNYIYPIDSLPSLMHYNLCGFNGVRGYKSMSLSADKFVMLRNDLLYRFNDFITSGINADYAYYDDIIYSFGFTTVLSSNKSKIKIYIAAPGWNKLSASVISGEISYVF